MMATLCRNGDALRVLHMVTTVTCASLRNV